MPIDDVKLEAISLLRFLPADAADIGEGVTRQELRDAGVGAWSAEGGRRDDLRPVLAPAPVSGAAADPLADYDEVLPLDEAEGDRDGADARPIRLRFAAP